MSRSVLPITEDIDRVYFGGQEHQDQIGLLEGVRSRFGRTFAGEPDRIAAELAADEAVRSVDTGLFTVPNQLGVAYNTRILHDRRHIAPASAGRTRRHRTQPANQRHKTARFQPTEWDLKL